MFDSIQLSPIFFLMGPLGVREKSGKSFQNATPRSGGSGTKVKERRVKLIPGRLGTVETSAAVIPVCSAAQQPCPKCPLSRAAPAQGLPRPGGESLWHRGQHMVGSFGAADLSRG